MNNNIDNLLARYFGGIASDNDNKQLDKWLFESTDNQLYFDEMTKLYEKLGLPSTIVPKPNTAAAKKAFTNYIDKSVQSKPVLKINQKPASRLWMFRAASVAIIVIVSVGIWIFNAEHEIILASKTTTKSDVLADQTQIELSKNSRIIYSSRFGKNNKNVRLEGEAFFKVGHKGDGSLHVSADETIIEDIGTVFSVSSYPDSDFVRVNVREGQVHFYTNNNVGLQLKTNDTGIYNKTTKTFKVYSIKRDSITPAIRHIQLNGVTLKDVAKIIGKEYDIKIKIADKNLENREITVNFDGEDVDIILQVIAKTLDVEVINEKEGFTFYNSENATQK